MSKSELEQESITSIALMAREDYAEFAREIIHLNDMLDNFNKHAPKIANADFVVKLIRNFVKKYPSYVATGKNIDSLKIELQNNQDENIIKAIDLFLEHFHCSLNLQLQSIKMWATKASHNPDYTNYEEFDSKLEKLTKQINFYGQEDEFLKLKIDEQNELVKDIQQSRNWIFDHYTNYLFKHYKNEDYVQSLKEQVNNIDRVLQKFIKQVNSEHTKETINIINQVSNNIGEFIEKDQKAPKSIDKVKKFIDVSQECIISAYNSTHERDGEINVAIEKAYEKLNDLITLFETKIHNVELNENYFVSPENAIHIAMAGLQVQNDVKNDDVKIIGEEELLEAI